MRGVIWQVTTFTLMLPTLYIRKKSPYVHIFESVVKGYNLVVKVGNIPKGCLQTLWILPMRFNAITKVFRHTHFLHFDRGWMQPYKTWRLLHFAAKLANALQVCTVNTFSFKISIFWLIEVVWIMWIGGMLS